jgi:hypothetical protein
MAMEIISLAGLFSTCVECFGYFKASQRLEEDCNILLVKLDIEKTRLLIWGNTAGILDTDSRRQSPALENETTIALVDRCLRSIESILTDTDRLRREYGVTKFSSPVERDITFVSSNSMNLFRTACKRFWVRHSSVRPRPNLLSRTKWAIYEKETFQGFINHLKDLIDGLYQIVPVPRESQDQIVEADIESITNLSQLRLLEAATEDSYRSWSAVARSVIEASEAGSTDRRNIEERLREGLGLNHDVVGTGSVDSLEGSMGKL